jgi:hypothetical protein
VIAFPASDDHVPARTIAPDAEQADHGATRQRERDREEFD